MQSSFVFIYETYGASVNSVQGYQTEISIESLITLKKAKLDI